LAEYPCDSHRARYNGPSVRVYLNAYRLEEKVQFKASICEACLDDLVTPWLTIALHRDDADVWLIPEDGQELQGLWQPAGASSDPFSRQNRL
jgi:hypothetical protein